MFCASFDFMVLNDAVSEYNIIITDKEMEKKETSCNRPDLASCNNAQLKPTNRSRN